MNDNQNGSNPDNLGETPIQASLLNIDSSDVLDQLDGDEKIEEVQTLSDEESSPEGEGGTKKRTRFVRPYPIQPFEESLKLAQAIEQFSPGNSARRLTLFNALNKSPDSGPSREWITSAGKYGLIRGSYSAEFLELTEEGKIASGEEYSEYERTQARVSLAIFHIQPFKALYDALVDKKFPSRQFLIDTAKGIVPDNLLSEALDIFTVNIKFLGLLQVMSGVERLVSLELLLEQLSNNPEKHKADTVSSTDDFEISEPIPTNPPIATLPKTKLTSEDICFYITPIGEPNSEQRLHADLFYEHIIKPALDGFGLRVERADHIEKSGVIGKQIIRHLLRSKLVIADLSFHNPNVFYELAIRHASRLPTVHIVRASDTIPFDLNQMRTIKIDASSIYSLIPRLNTYKAEIAAQVRLVLENPDDPEITDNPLSVFYPTFRVSFD